MLSIGKLSHLVHMEEANLAEDSILDGKLYTIYVFPSLMLPKAFHDGLDFVSVHESLLQDLRSCLVAARTRQSLDAQLDTILKAKGGGLIGKTAFTHVISSVSHTFTLAKDGNPDFQGSRSPITPRESLVSRGYRRFANIKGQHHVC